MMAGTSFSSSSSCASSGSLDDLTVRPCCTIKFVCSHGGRILPRYPDGRLRYVGGETRVLSFNRSVSFSEFQMKLGKMCGWDAVSMRCQLPTEDLDALISITSDEDLANLIEEYDLANRDRQCPLKIRAFLHATPIKSPKSLSNEHMESVKEKYPLRNPVLAVTGNCIHLTSLPMRFSGNSSGWYPLHGPQAHEIPSPVYRHPIHSGIYRQ